MTETNSNDVTKINKIRFLENMFQVKVFLGTERKKLAISVFGMCILIFVFASINARGLFTNIS